MGRRPRQRPRWRRDGSKPTVTHRFPQGHYHSPVTDLRELEAEPRRSQVWPREARAMPGVDWNDDAQVALCREVFARQDRLELARDRSEDPTSYFASNGQYP